MATWQTILFAIGSQSVMMAILAFLAKSVIQGFIQRDSKVFESDLKAKTDREIERFKSELNLNVESYKIQLKKSEFLFQKEFEAASKFTSIIQSIHPGFHNPLMDWSDACEVIARDFGKTERLLNDFLANHGAILIEKDRKKLTAAISDAGYGKFDIGENIDPETSQLASNLYNNLISLEKSLINRVRSQSSL